MLHKQEIEFIETASYLGAEVTIKAKVVEIRVGKETTVFSREMLPSAKGDKESISAKTMAECAVSNLVRAANEAQ